MANIFEGLDICIISDCIGQKRLQILQSNVLKGGGKLISKEQLLSAITRCDRQDKPFPVQLVTVLPLDRLIAALNPENAANQLCSLLCPQCGQMHVRVHNDTFISKAVGQRRRPTHEILIPQAPAIASGIDSSSTSSLKDTPVRPDSLDESLKFTQNERLELTPANLNTPISNRADEDELQWARVGNKRVLDQLNELSEHFKVRHAEIGPCH